MLDIRWYKRLSQQISENLGLNGIIIKRAKGSFSRTAIIFETSKWWANKAKRWNRITLVLTLNPLNFKRKTIENIRR